MKKISIFIFSIIFFCTLALQGQSQTSLSGKVVDQNQKPISDVLVQVLNTDDITVTKSDGAFSLALDSNESYTITFKHLNSDLLSKDIYLARDTNIQIELTIISSHLPEILVKSDADAFGIRQLRSVEAGGIYEGKKSEVIDLEKLISNKAGNNARQAFAKVPSLNIWESDNAGLQLDIGGRGLSPRRSTNFNIRQNGYDISADALGYPESYYTPPLQAVKQIEIVRGAGALQYGSQFGGLVNFKIKEGNSEKPLNIESENSYGAFNFLNSFNSIHGQVGKFNYYTYFQYKRGDGWRDNSNFEQYAAGGYFKYKVSDKLQLGLDLTFSHYLSRQPGGHTDESFALDPQSSNRERNWFRVNWNLAAFLVEYDNAKRIKIFSRSFGLAAQRTSLGLLETPDLPDPLSNRDLLDGVFRNLGNETRFVYNYPSKNNLDHTLLVGTRIYSGNTNFSQQFGTTGADADFTRVDTAFLERTKSDFEFPNTNFVVFAEKIFRLSDKVSLIPGARYEIINTESDGVFTVNQRLNSFGDFIEVFEEERSSSNRNVFLYGLGLSNKFSEKYELYANATSNYRAINFTDVQIQTNTQVVDPNIQDESGYSFDLGIRKRDFSPFYLEAGLFYILYNNRIGEVIDDGLRLRTNIGDARIFGAELFFETDIFKLLRKEVPHKLSVFVNGSVNRGVYTDINDRALVGVRSGNSIEELPDYNIKVGLNYGYGKFKSSLQSTFIGEQFSDAANTRTPVIGVFGVIPAYQIFDFSAQYELNPRIDISVSVNNLFDADYFTRRAPAYPGPGIIPGSGRIWSVSLKVNFVD